MADIEIEIDGRKLIAKPNQTVIQAADEANIYIPRFCYHKELSIPANCRMCLVEMEKSPKAVPACATPVMPGMKIYTKSQKTLLAQRAVMEFLLINHPLDCPICDQGGECELQDLSMGYGSSHSNYKECKRAVADENLGPLIATEMTRCILCTRCIRFGDEIAGMRELGMTFRGEIEEVTTFVQHAMKSEVSGNIIDLCPVGALTSKPYRFTARAWELNQFPSVSPHDCLGSNIHVHTREGTVMRVVSRENSAINQTWISDRDRFSYAGLYHEDRLSKPLVKTNGVWQAVEWRQAFETAAAKLQAVIKEHGSEQVAGLASPNSTLEEFYLLQKIIRGLGSDNIDHRLRECDTQYQTAFPSLGTTLAEIEQYDAVLLIGSHLQKEQPLAALRMRKAAAKGAAISVVNPVDYDFNFKVHAKKIIAPHHMVNALQEIVKALEENKNTSTIAQQLKGKNKPFILLGAMALQHKQASLIKNLAEKIAGLTNAKMGWMTSGANAAGAWVSGAVPHSGLNAYQMLEKPRQAYVLLNIEPELDCANAHAAVQAMQHASCVIAISAYRNAVLEQHADVIFPMAAFTESSGTYVNAMGDWQSIKGIAKSFGESRPAWKILRVLGNFLHLDHFDYESSEEIRNEVRAFTPHPTHAVSSDISFEHRDEDKKTLTRIGEIPIYAVDSLVRRSEPLQKAQLIMEGEAIAVKLHSETAKRLQLQNGSVVKVKQQTKSMELPVKIDDRIAVDAAWVAGGIAATRELGDLFGEIEIEKV